MKVLIVDDHPIVISGCRAMLESESGFEVVAASSAEAAERAFAAARPDVTVIDINLPGISGFELVRRILRDHPDARIIMFSMNDDPIFVAQSIEAGAKGYVSKNDNPADFLRAIRAVAAGEVFLAANIAARLALYRGGGHSQDGPRTQISARDTEILRLLAKGRSMSEIANLIDVSYKTVATACASLRTRLRARTPMELVRIAVEQKII